MKSMTAFGRAIRKTADVNVCVDIKSVNSRFLDLSIRLPRAYSYLEEKIRPVISNSITRGKVDINISVELFKNESTKITLDKALTKSYLDALQELRDTFGLTDDISVMKVAENRDIFVVTSDSENDTIFDNILPAIEEALQKFDEVRTYEGNALCADLLKKGENIKQMTSLIQSKSEQCIAAYRDKMEARIRKIIDDNHVDIDENRLLTECAIYADRVSVDEELVRLSSHLEAYKEILSSTEPSGKRLDFLIQEMNRETNTIGSKCMDAEIAKIVVSMKNEIEKIREQVQNLE